MTWQVAFALGVFALLLWRKWAMRRTPEQLADVDAALREGGALIDVRTAQEFAHYHLPGARNVPLAEIGPRADELKRESGLVLYCASGARSARARALLEGRGLSGVLDLGSMRNWARLEASRG